MEKQKKVWVTPELIVLVRSKPEEAVLVTCKNPSTHTGPGLPNCKNPGSGNDCLSVLRS